MRIDCLHGYFKFYETAPGQVSKFMSLYDLELERSGDHFTFADLVDAPTHSITGGTFLGIPTLETLEGEPWEIMRANDLVYNFVLGLVMPILTVIGIADLDQAGNSYISNGLLLPGSLVGTDRVRDFSGFWLQDRANFKYSEVSFE